MSNQQTLQNIWSMTDKHSIDIMTKSKRATPVQKYSDSSSDTDSSESSDSDSAQSSRGSFVAVPEEFRPQLPPSLSKQKNEAKKAQYVQKPMAQNKNLTSNAYPRSERNCPLPKYQKGKQMIFQTSTTDIKRHATSSQNTKNIDNKILQKTSKVVSDTTILKGTQEKLANNSIQNKTQGHVLTSKASNCNKKQRNKLQYEYVGEIRGTITINFDSGIEKNSSSKGLKYEILEKETTKYETSQGISDGKTKFQENIIKWDNSLHFNEQKDPQYNIKPTVIFDSKPFAPKTNKNTDNKNFKQFNNEPKCNQMKKSARRNFHQKRMNKSKEVTLNQTEPKIAYQIEKLEIGEKKSSTEIQCHNNNIQPQNIKCVRNKICNSNANFDTFRMNRAHKWQFNSNEQNITQNTGLYPSLSNVTQKNQEFNQKKELTSKLNNTDNEKMKDAEELQSILSYGRDISDLIIGSHTALSAFISLQKEWKISRRELIKHFELLENNLKESSKKFTKYRDVINLANTSATVASSIPHPYVSIAARVVSVLTSLISTFLNKQNNDTRDTNEITTSLFKETHASGELYMYGLQCNQQFEETTKLIEKFHSVAEKDKLSEIENREIAKFIQDVLEYKPAHRVFYKKLRRSFQELMDNGNSSDARKFCEPFTIYTSALDVIEYLDWRFRYEDFNSDSVRYELEHIHQLIENSNSTNLKDLVQRIQKCIRILNDELTFIERSLKDITLFDTVPGPLEFCK